MSDLLSTRIRGAWLFGSSLCVIAACGGQGSNDEAGLLANGDPESTVLKAPVTDGGQTVTCHDGSASGQAGRPNSGCSRVIAFFVAQGCEVTASDYPGGSTDTLTVICDGSFPEIPPFLNPDSPDGAGDEEPEYEWVDQCSDYNGLATNAPEIEYPGAVDWTECGASLIHQRQWAQQQEASCTVELSDEYSADPTGALFNDEIRVLCGPGGRIAHTEPPPVTDRRVTCDGGEVEAEYLRDIAYLIEDDTDRMSFLTNSCSASVNCGDAVPTMSYAEAFLSAQANEQPTDAEAIWNQLLESGCENAYFNLACDPTVASCELFDNRVADGGATIVVAGVTLTALEITVLVGAAITLGYLSADVADGTLDGKISALRTLSLGQLWNAFVEAHFGSTAVSTGAGGTVFNYADFSERAEELLLAVPTVCTMWEPLRDFRDTMDGNGDPLDDMVEAIVEAFLNPGPNEPEACRSVDNLIKDLLCDLLDRLSDISHVSGGVVSRAIGDLAELGCFED